MTTQITVSLLVLLVLIPTVRDQSQSFQTSTQAHEQGTTREERKKRALALVEEVVNEARSLKLPENRIRVAIAMVGHLWSRDEKRARVLFKEAVATLGDMQAAVRTDDLDALNLAHLPGALRHEMSRVVGRLDPKLALDFVRATDPATQGGPIHHDQLAEEAQLEMSIALELAVKDPGEALAIGEAALKHGIDNNAMNLLTRLQSTDRATAHRFLGAMLNRLRTEDFNTNAVASYVVVELLRNWIDVNRKQASKGAQHATGDLPKAILDEPAARELGMILIKVLLDEGTSGLALHRFARADVANVAQQLTGLLPGLMTASARQPGALRKRLLELEKINGSRQAWIRYQGDVDKDTVETLLEAAKTAPPEFADGLIQNAAWRALSENDEMRAREIAERVANPKRRAETAANVERHLATQAGQRGEFAKARRLLSGIPSMDERARLLAQWASTATSSGDKALALELLSEAEGLVGNRALNYSQLGTQLQIAHAYSQLDPKRRTAIVEAAIDRLNELAAAASVLNGFDLHQYFRQGEFVISNGYALNDSVQALAGELGSLAAVDPDRARSLAERFERREMRLMALLQIAGGAMKVDD